MQRFLSNILIASYFTPKSTIDLKVRRKADWFMVFPLYMFFLENRSVITLIDTPPTHSNIYLPATWRKKQKKAVFGFARVPEYGRYHFAPLFDLYCESERMVWLLISLNYLITNQNRSFNRLKIATFSNPEFITPYCSENKDLRCFPL